MTWLYILLSACACFLIYLLISNGTYGVQTIRLAQEDLTRDLHIVHLSDLHGRRYPQDIVRSVRSEKPDLILITGDMFREDGKRRDHVLSLLDQLSAAAPVYAIFGNHEHRFRDPGQLQSLVHDMRSHGARLLFNDLHTQFIKGQPVTIAGLDEIGPQMIHVHTAPPTQLQQQVMERLSSMGGEKLLLCHYPENFTTDRTFPYNQYDFDVMFAGHAHGGQVRLPGLGGLFAPGQGVLPRLTAGVTGSRPALIVSRGLGGRWYLPRVFNRPQILHVILTPKKQERK